MSTSQQPEFDPAAFRFAAKQQGYTEDEIDEYIRQREPVKKGFFVKLKEDSDRQEAKFKSAFLGGLANTADRAADITQGASALNPALGGVSAIAKKGSEFLRSKMPKAEEMEAPAGQTTLDRYADNASTIMGGIAGDLPVNALIGGVVGKGALSLAKAVTPNSIVQKLLTGSVPGSYFKSVAASAPLNMAESVLTDAIVHPESVMSKEGIARSAGLGLLGAAAQGIKGGAKAPVQGPQPFSPLGDILAGPRAPTTVLLTAKLDQDIFDPARPFKDMEDVAQASGGYNLARRLAGVEDQIHLNQNEVKMIPQKNGTYVRGKSLTQKALVQSILNGPQGVAKGDAAVETLVDWDKYILGKSGYALAADASEVAKEVLDIEARNPHFASLLPAYKAHTDELVDMMHGYELIDDEVRDTMKSSLLYVPTGRQVTNPNANANHLKAKQNTASLREIKSPMQQLFEIERRIIQRGEANKLGNAILNEIENTGDKWKGRLEKVTRKNTNAPIEATIEMVRENYKQAGLPVPTLKQLRAEAEFVSDEILDGSTGTLQVMRNGMPQEIRVADPMVLEFFKSRKYVDGSSIGNAARDVERFTTRTFFQPFRELTGNNAVLDQIEAFFNTKWNEYVPGWDFVKGVAATVRKDPRSRMRIALMIS